VTSDTHGLLRPDAAACLRGPAMISQAGDIGSVEVTTVLENLCPVRATGVRWYHRRRHTPGVRAVGGGSAGFPI